MRFACLILSMLALVGNTVAQQISVLPKVTEVEFPAGYDVIDTNGNLVKAHPDDRKANVQAFIDQGGTRLYISDWSFGRMKNQGIKPNLIKPRQAEPDGQVTSPDQLVRELGQALPPSSAQALATLFRKDVSANSGSGQKSWLVEELPNIAESVTKNEEQISRMRSFGIPSPQVDAVREYIHYNSITSYGGIDWTTYDELFNNLISPISETLVPDESILFPNPAVGHEDDWTKGTISK